jgi:hypothetical protein
MAYTFEVDTVNFQLDPAVYGDETSDIYAFHQDALFMNEIRSTALVRPDIVEDLFENEKIRSKLDKKLIDNEGRDLGIFRIEGLATTSPQNSSLKPRLDCLFGTIQVVGFEGEKIIKEALNFETGDGWVCRTVDTSNGLPAVVQAYYNPETNTDFETVTVYNDNEISLEQILPRVLFCLDALKRGDYNPYW